ncbi:MAG TPA: sporulation-delaying protein SdpB family protein [Pyrinomonadaceae bacterium]|nr:sporulation-delaying protein SdpB family protein [Pyrinomonadaceae bacterium]
MNEEVLIKLGRWVRPWTIKDPFTNVYGLSRTLLAVATACTLAFNSTEVLFTPAAGINEVPKCGPGLLSASLFCAVSPAHLEIMRWLCIAVLLVVASGWRPRLTAILHLCVAYSFFISVTVFDGGDQITLVLTVLLLPVALLDGRRWHWANIPNNDGARPLAYLVAWSALYMVRVQVAAVYFVSGIAKLGQAEWANGTAMYYWLLTFGRAPRWAVAFMSHPIFVVAATWGALVLEVALAAAILLPRRRTRPLLYIGIFFHFLIALFFGLWSFSMAMTAALIMYLRPVDEPLPLGTFPNREDVGEKSAVTDASTVGSAS